MKNIVLAVIALVFAMPLLAADGGAADQQYLEQCHQYAKEDGVSAEEMDEYVISCVRDLKETEESLKD